MPEEEDFEGYSCEIILIYDVGYSIGAVGKTGRGAGAGAGDFWIKSGDWELRRIT